MFIDCQPERFDPATACAIYLDAVERVDEALHDVQALHAEQGLGPNSSSAETGRQAAGDELRIADEGVMGRHSRSQGASAQLRLSYVTRLIRPSLWRCCGQRT